MRVAVSAGENILRCEEPTVAAWVNNYSTRYASMDDWLSVAEAQIAAAAGEGARIFLFPELISEAWLCFARREDILPSSTRWQAEQGEIFLEAMRRFAHQYDMLIVAGTFLQRGEEGGWRNRASVLFPDGREEYQDKLHLMPDERELAGLEGGEAIRLIHFEGMKIAIVICLDVQIPKAIHTLHETGNHPDLILVPSMTVRRAGYNRVFTCSAARAIELHCPVIVVGGVGSFDFRDEVETNVSGAALFIPCETVFGMDGKREGIGPLDESDEAAGHLFIARHVPVFACQIAREDGLCEAWYLPNHRLPVFVEDTAKQFGYATDNAQEVEIAA